ncbi:hypothetical protein D3C85_1740430 [compost metagenome]
MIPAPVQLHQIPGMGLGHAPLRPCLTFDNFIRYACAKQQFIGKQGIALAYCAAALQSFVGRIFAICAVIFQVQHNPVMNDLDLLMIIHAWRNNLL